MEVGQVCIKTRGREAGRRVVVLSKPKNGRVLVDGTRTKRKEYNVLHLFPLNEMLSIKENESHEGVIKALSKSK